jgi:hypothetical protein
MHLDTYTDLFRELARRHKAIAASPTNGRFMRIFISADPVQKQIDTVEFYTSLRSKLKAPIGQPVLVVQNYQVDYGDNQGDYFSRQLHGAFLVLQQVKLDDPDARDVAVANCELIGEQVLAAALQQLRDQYEVFVSLNDCWSEHIGPIGDGHVGVRVNLSWKEGASEELTYNPDLFTA